MRLIKLSQLLAPLAATLCLSACGTGNGSTSADLTPNESSCALDPRGETYTPGMAQPSTNQLFTVKLLTALPGPPEKGDNTWTVSVVDKNGAPVTGATLTVNPFMPDHGHGTPIVVGVTEMGGGQYQLTPLNLFMAGVWRITITVMSANDASTDQSVFYFCIEG